MEMEPDLCSLDLSARGLYLLKSGLWADVRFEVGQERIIIEAHRLLLRSSSQVFEAMMNESLASSELPYPVPDVTPGVFKIMLEFIYSDKIESPATIEQLPGIEYVTKKYVIPRLLLAYNESLLKALNAENVIKYYEYAASKGNQQLIDECTQIFQTKEIAPQNLLHAKLSTLQYILAQETLPIVQEIDLLAVIEAYAKTIAMKVEEEAVEEIEAEQQKLTVRPLLQQIRFLSVGHEILALNYHRLRQFLSESELLHLIINSMHSDVVPMPEGFSTNKIGRNLVTPFLIPVQGEVTVGRVFTIRCFIERNANRFDVNLKNNDDVTTGRGTILHISVRISARDIVLNTNPNGDWGPEERPVRRNDFPIVAGTPCEVTIIVHVEFFEVKLNGNTICSYEHRMPFRDITHFGATGDIRLTGILC